MEQAFFPLKYCTYTEVVFISLSQLRVKKGEPKSLLQNLIILHVPLCCRTSDRREDKDLGSSGDSDADATGSSK
ncbi:hypothetical protein AVEN_106912-1 [Araneus ventricosus]|uniref:Uncharacterized protein n=1 Tax=Araneus ventricosus TaxID=182803 RepID=A0A4Y2RP08_ARAVE|nr:hypothetical protein AVEN_106912-1 [Araneus ventricosus]